MTIEVDIYGRNMDVKDDLRDYVNKKVTKLDRYLAGIEEARVDLSSSKSARSVADRQVAQITVQGKGFILRAEERAETIYSALDKAVEKIQRRMERYKGKRTQHSDRRTVSDVITAPQIEAVESEEEDIAPVIARRKKFLLVPMDELEALEQMGLLGHNDFFVFYNANTSMVNVLYKRRDGTYGLIEPEIA